VSSRSHPDPAPPQTDAGAARRSTETTPQPFRGSRWVTLPGHARDVGAQDELPAGFRGAGVACGIKPSGREDLGLLVCDAPHPVSAACFTTSATPAAPVLVSRGSCRLDGLRAVLASSGCANAATGEQGIEDAVAAQRAAALALGVDAAEVALASTGGIGDRLPMGRVLDGIVHAAGALSERGAGAFGRAIMTTDAFQKRASVLASLPSGEVRLSAQCKGAGMISPRFATMLCFVQTDAALDPETASLLLRACVGRSFDRISVDGQLSTNDTVILMASGASGVRVALDSEDELRFAAVLDALLRALALLIVKDGEGAGRIARVVVRGGAAGEAELAARAIGTSPLVKAALHGGDPNWGRMVQAVGGALAGPAPGALAGPRPAARGTLPVGVAIEGIEVCAQGAAVAYDERALARAVAREEVEYEVTLGPGGGGAGVQRAARRGAGEPGGSAAAPGGEEHVAELFFSDLSQQYVRVNAEYTT
jgi:glutamate N-acetyltransferase/amino-acid N-acetyltransferase